MSNAVHYVNCIAKEITILTSLSHRRKENWRPSDPILIPLSQWCVNWYFIIYLRSRSKTPAIYTSTYYTYVSMGMNQFLARIYRILFNREPDLIYDDTRWLYHVRELVKWLIRYSSERVFISQKDYENRNRSNKSSLSYPPGAYLRSTYTTKQRIVSVQTR